MRPTTGSRDDKRGSCLGLVIAQAKCDYGKSSGTTAKHENKYLPSDRHNWHVYSLGMSSRERRNCAYQVSKVGRFEVPRTSPWRSKPLSRGLREASDSPGVNQGAC